MCFLIILITTLMPFPLYVYAVYIFMPLLAFILFVSRWYSPKEILLNQTFNKYSRHNIENLLRGSSIPFYGQSKTLQCRPNHRYRFITWLTHKNNCQLLRVCIHQKGRVQSNSVQSDSRVTRGAHRSSRVQSSLREFQWVFSTLLTVNN